MSYLIAVDGGAVLDTPLTPSEVTMNSALPGGLDGDLINDATLLPLPQLYSTSALLLGLLNS